VLSDGDEGLKWIQEREFSEASWLLDRWHIAQNVRTLVRGDQPEHRRIMAAVWKADSEAVLEALRTSSYRHTQPWEFNALFGYILGNRDWHRQLAIYSSNAASLHRSQTCSRARRQRRH
jgi:hypothetical protein